MVDEVHMPEKKVSTFVVSMHTYVDEHGRTVDEKRPVIGEPPVGFVRFTARASLTMTFEYGKAERKFEVPLPRATTVQEAFAQIVEEYPAAMKEAADKCKAEVMVQMAERTGQAAIATAPANILDLEGNLRGMRDGNTKGRHKRRRGR